MTEKELYGELGILTKNKDQWKENLPQVGTLLRGQTTKITAKALWLLGEMGLVYPKEAAGFVPSIAAFLADEEDLLRERALHALGRIGRANYEIVKPYLDDMLSLSRDGSPGVRLSLIWASENIATNAPHAYDGRMGIFSETVG